VKGKRKFTVLIERDEQGYYVATVPELPGYHTQAKKAWYAHETGERSDRALCREWPQRRWCSRASRHPADIRMTRLPRLKGKEVIRILEKHGLEYFVLRAVITFCATPMAAW